jgi:hypothetical protein
MGPITSWISSNTDLIIAIAAVVQAVAAVVILFSLLVSKRQLKESEQLRQEEKMPVLMFKARLEGTAWQLRIINAGNGPAFIKKFHTKGLKTFYADGCHTGDIDSVIGSEVGDPDQQIMFACGGPDQLRDKQVYIEIEYEDIYGNRFKSLQSNGRLEFQRIERKNTACWVHRLIGH